jgi:hypothetical protein
MRLGKICEKWSTEAREIFLEEKNYWEEIFQTKSFGLKVGSDNLFVNENLWNIFDIHGRTKLSWHFFGNF